MHTEKVSQVSNRYVIYLLQKLSRKVVQGDIIVVPTLKSELMARKVFVRTKMGQKGMDKKFLCCFKIRTLKIFGRNVGAFRLVINLI